MFSHIYFKLELSKKEIEDHYKLTLGIIEKYKNSDEYNYTGGFYI